MIFCLFVFVSLLRPSSTGGPRVWNFFTAFIFTVIALVFSLSMSLIRFPANIKLFLHRLFNSITSVFLLSLPLFMIRFFFSHSSNNTSFLDYGRVSFTSVLSFLWFHFLLNFLVLALCFSSPILLTSAISYFLSFLHFIYFLSPFSSLSLISVPQSSFFLLSLVSLFLCRK